MPPQNGHPRGCGPGGIRTRICYLRRVPCSRYTTGPDVTISPTLRFMRDLGHTRVDWFPKRTWGQQQLLHLACTHSAFTKFSRAVKMGVSHCAPRYRQVGACVRVPAERQDRKHHGSDWRTHSFNQLRRRHRDHASADQRVDSDDGRRREKAPG